MSVIITGTNTKELLEMRSSRGTAKLAQFTTRLESTIDSVVRGWATQQASGLLAQISVAGAKKGAKGP